MREIQTITILGQGALGVMYGQFLSEHLPEAKIYFLADAGRIDRYEKEKVYCNGKECQFSYLNCQEKQDPSDLLIFAVKGTGLKQAIRDAAAVVGEDTILVSVMNGISSEEEIGKAFGSKNVLPCVVQGMDAVKIGNQMTYKHLGKVCIGADRPEKEKQLDLVCRMMDRAGLPYQREEDVLRRLWGKWMLNVGVNQTVMVHEGTYGTVQKEGKEREQMKSAMREVIRIAEKAGISVTEKELEAYVALIDTLDPEGMPSMRQDGLQRRPSEVELFAGTVIRKGKEFGVDVPVNEELYRQVREMESRY